MTSPALSAAAAGTPSPSTLTGTAPVLIGLLVLISASVVLLGLAAVPPRRIPASALAAIVSARRVEFGVVGVTVLACAAVGLVVTFLIG